MATTTTRHRVEPQTTAQRISKRSYLSLVVFGVIALASLYAAPLTYAVPIMLAGLLLNWRKPCLISGIGIILAIMLVVTLLILGLAHILIPQLVVTIPS